MKGSAYYGEGDGIIYDRKYNCEGPLRFCFEYSDYCENNEDVGVSCSNGNVLKKSFHTLISDGSTLIPYV